MKKLSLAVLVSMVLAACTADVYSTKGDADLNTIRRYEFK